MDTARFKGLGVAMVTPFQNDGSVDFEALEILTNKLINGGVDYLVVLGTTGETPTLTHEEQFEVSSFIIKINNGRVPIMLGVGGNDTAKIIKQLHIEDFSGVDAILSVVPYYNKPTQEGIYQHFSAIASSTNLPILLYNIPGRTGVNMDPDTVARLSFDHENIFGIKEASGNLEQMQEVIRRSRPGFLVISGDDGFTVPLIKCGGHGVISVLGNAYPEKFGRIVKLALSKKFSEAEEQYDRFEKLVPLLFADGNPAGVKVVLEYQKVLKNNLRLPIVPARKETQERIIEEVKRLG